MTQRQALIFVCDELLISLNGKYTVAGLYTGDIVVPQIPAQLPQLVIMFEITTTVDNPFKTLILQVSIPGESVPRRLDLSPTVQSALTLPTRSMLMYRFPFLIQSVKIQQSGPIEAMIIHEDGELSAGQQWIVTIAEAQANIASSLPKT